MIENKRLDTVHPDINYLMQEEIGMVLAKGLAACYTEQPLNPVDFMGKWLKQHSKVQAIDALKIGRDKRKKESKEIEEREEKIRARVAQEAEQEKEEKETDLKEFKEKISESEDLKDNLQELCDFIQKRTGVAGVYIGEYKTPQVKVEDKDDDQAHLPLEENPEITILHSSPDNSMVNQSLKKDKGVTH